jgi:DNA-binding NarL/FixJ family response regulator
MIVCAIDDLLFSIKIKEAAKQLGVELYFERSADRIVDTVRDKQPSLVIFDLNSAKLSPMEAIRAIKADASLRRVKTLGYVSHVDSATIAAARDAGVDDVLARSAFAMRLGDILTSA